ncbi:MAG: WecB/TagA/CpsF family glycosyltransferase [Planctomycetota bacterium]|nr:WecB/TagA/CpsF family glycosyltransferase [Planctomycetota bacterium]
MVPDSPPLSAPPRRHPFHAGSSTRTPSSITPSVGETGSPAGLMADPLGGTLAPATQRHDPAEQPQLLGLPLWPHGRSALFELIAGQLGAPEGGEVLGAPLELHSVNAEISIQVRSDERYRELLAGNPFNLPDGEWVKRFAGLKHGRGLERISGSDMVGELCELAHELDQGVFLLGASEEVSAEASRRLEASLPGLQLGRYAPPFEVRPDVSPEVSREALLRIAEARPAILLAFLGSPKQELWFRQHSAELSASGVRLVLGAGAGLDFLAGRVRRAPRFISQLGFEWLWRLAHQPRARFHRALTRLPRFLVLALADALRGRASGTAPLPPHQP